MLGMSRVLVALTVAVFTSSVIAQRTVGEVLDAGGKKLSDAQFNAEITQRLIVGPTPTGGSVQIVYGANGVVAGSGTIPNAPSRLIDRTQVSGEWNIDAEGRVCAKMQFRTEGGGPGPARMDFLPPRCQVWFKLGPQYFVADTESDRSAKVLVRTLKR